jgi:hypothetical protein
MHPHQLNCHTHIPLPCATIRQSISSLSAHAHTPTHLPHARAAAVCPNPQIKIDIEDRAHRPALVRISADSVRLHVTINVASEGSREEILGLFSKVLNVRIAQLQVRSRSPEVVSQLTHALRAIRHATCDDVCVHV